ncbi:hypothetical protein EGW08_023612 [Elysia chlorotica]|uniref:Uncharacterized protein n=1 Tax=Elysia chlorotica TaxID=188477 RepID=A0A3S0Z1E9_ELYCH|nr:hypothetical protein EGW08_023612 [Elysia chlorotica]
MKCGFMTSKAGRPDMYRAANKILRLAVEGQLCLCFFPPGFSANSESLASDPETDRVAQSLCGKTRRQGTTGQGSLVEEEEEEDDESSNSGSESGEPEKLESLGMFDQLRIQDDDEAGLADDT